MGRLRWEGKERGNNISFACKEVNWFSCDGMASARGRFLLFLPIVNRTGTSKNGPKNKWKKNERVDRRMDRLTSQTRLTGFFSRTVYSVTNLYYDVEGTIWIWSVGIGPSLKNWSRKIMFRLTLFQPKKQNTSPWFFGFHNISKPLFLHDSSRVCAAVVVISKRIFYH